MMKTGMSKTILLVEDEVLIAMSEARLLQKCGYEVITANSGEEAIEITQKSPEIDLVLMDINLGRGMDGRQTAELILAHRDIPLVFLSSHTDREAVEKTQGIASYGYVVKNSGEMVLMASISMAFKLFDVKMKERSKEEALRHERDRAQSYLNTVETIIIALDIEGRVTMINRKGCQVLGYRADELVAKLWFSSFVPQPDGMERIYPLFLRMLEGELDAMEYFENPIITRSGEVRHIAWHNSLLRNDDGMIIGALSAGEDITERRVAENALREREARLKTVVENTPDVILHVDKDAKIIFVNQLLPGLTEQRVIGSSIYEWVPPEQHAMLASTFEAAFLRGEPGEYESFGPGPNGESRIYTVRVRPIVLDGKTDSAIYTATDITAYKHVEQSLAESEQRFRSLAALAPVGIYRADANGNYLYVNKRWCEMTCLEAQQAMGSGWASGIHEQDRPGVLAAWARMIQTRGSWDMEYRFQTLAGEVTWVKSLAIPQEDGHGQIIGYIGVNTDITESKQAGLSLQEAVQEKQELLRELQHRVKNSFSLMTSMMSLAQDASHSDEACAVLADMTARVRAMAELYDLLYVTEVVAQARLDEYCPRIVAAFQLPQGVYFQQSYATITVSTKIATPLGLILTELVTNAIKHAFPDRQAGEISISLERNDPLITLRVADNGVGFPANFNLAQSASLGLTLVELLTRQIGGSFHIEHGNGTGCVVVFPS